MESHNISKVELRNLQMEDYDQLARSFKRIYGDEDVFWTKAQIKKLITIFPEGQVVIIVDDKIVGCALSIIVDYNMVKGDHTYAQVTGNETFNTHNAKGNILADCVWLDACTSIARNSAKNSTSRLSCSADAYPTITSMPTRCDPRNISNVYAHARYTTRCLHSS